MGVDDGEGLGASTAKGLIVLNMAGWLGVAIGLLAGGKGATTACVGFIAGLETGLGLAGGVLFVVSVFALVAAPGLTVEVGVVALPACELAFFGVTGAVVLATKYSCALKTFKQEPQRTAPLADCS